MRHLFFLFLLLVSLAATAQPQNQNAKEKIKKLKVRLIKENLALTEEDSQKFFPMYNAYEVEKRENRKMLNKLKKGFMAKSDEQLKIDLEKMISIKEEELNIEKKYFNKFLTVLSPRQLAALYHTETQFKKKLLERYGQKN